METLKKPGGIAEKWPKVKPVSFYAKNYELVWNKIKDLDRQSENYQGITRLAHAKCRRNFHNKKKLETNSKRKLNEIDEQNSKDVDHIDDDRTNSEESTSVLRRINKENIACSAGFVCEKDKVHYYKYGSTEHENLMRCEPSSGGVSLKRAMMDNLESDNSSLVAAVKRLKIDKMISDKDAYSADVFYHQRCYSKFTRTINQLRAIGKPKVV